MVFDGEEAFEEGLQTLPNQAGLHLAARYLRLEVWEVR